MTREQIKLSLQKNKLQLSQWDKLSHFAIVGYILFISFLMLFFSIKDLINDKAKGFNDLPLFFISLLLALLFYKVQSNKLVFKRIGTRLSQKQITEIINQISHQNKWEIVRQNRDVIIVKTHPHFTSGSWGEEITVLFKKDGILVNSICDPEKRISVVSMGRNKMNVKKLIDEIEISEKNFTSTMPS